MPDDPTAPNDRSSAVQFRLSTVFVLTLVASILAAFLSPRGNDLMLAGAISVLGSFAFALGVGLWSAPLANRIFWGVVIAAMMQAVAAETTLLDRRGIYAWPLAAGFAAVMAAGNGNLYSRMLFSAVTASLIIVAYVLSLGVAGAVFVPYISCAAIGGALLAILIDGVNWLERKHRLPQPAVGLTLVIAAIGFALIAPDVIPGW